MNFFSDELIRRLRAASKVCVLTGAGISAESGVPTFRDSDGLWKKFRPEELANVEAFLANPDLVWEWYSYRRRVVSDVRPNPGHLALVELEKRYGEGFTLVTQNVDNLHHRAGSNDVLELHGNIARSYCIDCREPWAEDPAPGANESAREEAEAPRCSKCGGLVRPDVVWFGEMLPAGAFEKAERAAVDCDVFLCVGTSGVVFPAALLPLSAAQAGAYVAEINPVRTDLSPRMSETCLGKAGEVLPAIVDELKSGRG